MSKLFEETKSKSNVRRAQSVTVTQDKALVQVQAQVQAHAQAQAQAQVLAQALAQAQVL